MKKIILLALIAALAGSASAFEVKTDAKQLYPNFKVTGWIKVTYQDTIYKDSSVTHPSGFEVKDAAITVGGDAWSNVSYKIYWQANRSSKAGDSTVYAAKLIDAYVEWKPSKLYSFRVGQFKRPFGLEHMASATNYDFVNLAQLSSKFNPSSRDQGVALYGVWNGLNYTLALFNGAPYNEKDKNWAKNMVSRIYYPAMAGMTVGGAMDYGTQNVKGQSLYNRQAALEFSWDWKKLLVRSEYMVGLNDKSLAADSVLVGADFVKRSGVDQNLMRGAYLTAGYVPIPRLRVMARADMYRQNYKWDLVTDGTNAWWDKTESRVMIYDLGADYFLNPNTKVTLNYEIRQEDLALRPVKNNLLMAQFQAKF